MENLIEIVKIYLFIGVGIWWIYQMFASRNTYRVNNEGAIFIVIWGLVVLAYIIQFFRYIILPRRDRI